MRTVQKSVSLKEGRGMFSLVCTSGLYTMKLYMLHHLLEDVSSFGNMSVLEAAVYKQFDVHIKRAYQGSSRRCATDMENTEMLMERQQPDTQHTLFTEVRSSL